MRTTDIHIYDKNGMPGESTEWHDSSLATDERDQAITAIAIANVDGVGVYGR